MNLPDATKESAGYAAGEPGGVSRPGFLPRHATLIVATPLVALLCLVAYRTARNAAYPFPLDTGEGTVLASAWQAATGHPVYNEVKDPPYVITVYNPVFIYLGAAAFKAAGPVLAAVRAISVACLVGAAILVYHVVRRQTGLSGAAVVAALVFLTSRPFFVRAGFAVTDYAGLFFSLAGLCLWLRGGKARIAALVAFTLAFMSKQSSIAAAAAAFLSLFLEGRREESVRLFTVFIVLVAATVAVCGLVFGRAYFVNVFFYATAAPFLVVRGLWMLAIVSASAPILIGGWLALTLRARRDASLVLPVTYVSMGFVTVFASGNLGSSASYFFDLTAGLSIVCGLLWARAMVSFGRSGVARTAAASAAVLQLVVTAASLLQPVPAHPFWPGVSISGDKTALALADDAAVAAAFRDNGGIILNRRPGYAISARAADAANDAYKLKQLIRRGVLRADLFTGPVRRQAFSVIIVPKDEGPWRFFTKDLRAAVEENYVLDHESAAHLFYLPQKRLTPSASD